MKNRIKSLLKKYTLEELAVKIGVSSSSIFKWKSGKVNPSRLAIAKIESITKKLTKKRSGIKR